jgi:hypothetical protein
MLHVAVGDGLMAVTWRTPPGTCQWETLVPPHPTRACYAADMATSAGHTLPAGALPPAQAQEWEACCTHMTPVHGPVGGTTPTACTTPRDCRRGAAVLPWSYGHTIHAARHAGRSCHGQQHPSKPHLWMQASNPAGLSCAQAWPAATWGPRQQGIAAGAVLPAPTQHMSLHSSHSHKHRQSDCCIHILLWCPSQQLPQPASAAPRAGGRLLCWVTTGGGGLWRGAVLLQHRHLAVAGDTCTQNEQSSHARK